MHDRLARVILDEIGKVAAADPLATEVGDHLAFARERAYGFTGRADVLEWLLQRVQAWDRNLLMVCGAPGSGKSALLAHAREVLAAAHPEAVIIARWIGATPASTQPRLLLAGLCRELARTFDFETRKTARLKRALGESSGLRQERRKIQEEYEIPNEMVPLARRFREFLAKVPGERTLIVILDALDQLEEQSPAELAAWLPETLPPNVCLLVSTTLGDHASYLQARLPRENVWTLGPLTMAEAESLLDGWLADAHRTLTAEQKAEVLQGFAACGLPLYLRLAYGEACRWRSYDGVPRLSRDVPGIAGDLFARLSAEANHGSVCVARSLGYLAAAKEGLGEDEMLDVLSSDGEVLADFRRRSPRSPANRRLPVVVWSRLLGDLEPYLTRRNAGGAIVLSFFHRQLREQIVTAYLGGVEAEARHRALARYFAAQPLELERDGGRQPNLRRMAELPYQLAWGGLDEELADLLSDYGVLRTRVAAGDLPVLLEDYDLAIARCQAGATPELRGRAAGLRLIRQALRGAAHILAEDPAQLATQLQGRLAGEDAPEVLRLIERIRDDRAGPWIRSLAPSLAAAGGPLWRMLRPPGKHGYDATLVAPMPDGLTLVTLARENLIVWDLKSGAERAIVDAGRALTTLAVFPDGRRALTGDLCGEVTLWGLPSATPQAAFHCGGRVTAARLSHDGRRAILAVDAGSGSGAAPAIEVWDLERETLAFALPGVQSSGPAHNTLALTPDDRRLLVVTPGAIRQWDLERQVELPVLSAAAAAAAFPALAGSADAWRDSLSCVVAAPGGKHAVSGSLSGRIVTWDLETGLPAGMIARLEGPVEHLALAPNGRTLVAAEYRVVHAWDLERRQAYEPLQGHTQGVTDLAITPDNRFAISASLDASIFVWDLGALGARSSAPRHPYAHTLQITNDGRTGVTISDDELKLWDLARCAETARIDGDFAVAAVAPGGAFAVSQGRDTDDVVVWDLATGGVTRRLRGPDTRLLSLTVSIDGRRIIGASKEALWFWDAATGRELFREQDTRMTGPEALALTPDGLYVVAGTWGYSLRFTELENGQQSITMDPNEIGQTAHVAISPDGALAMTAAAGLAGEADTLELWELARGVAGRHTLGQWDTITSLAVTPDGRYALIACAGAALAVYDLQRRAVALRFSGDSNIERCAVAPDGSVIMAQDQSGKVYFLSLENLEQGPPVVTAWRAPVSAWQFWRSAERQPAGVHCPYCHAWYEVPGAALGRDVPCPGCHAMLRVNSFCARGEWRAADGNRQPAARHRL